MKDRLAALVILFLLASLPLAAALAAEDGAAVYKDHCAACHESGGDMRMPDRDSFQKMTPEQILTALENGAMVRQASSLSDAERRAVSEFLSAKHFGAEPTNAIPKSAFCGGGAPIDQSLSGPAWLGWGVTAANKRFQSADAAGISASDLPRLKLKWAFGFPGEVSASAQPVVAGGRLYVGSFTGKVYSLDARTGCVHWIYDAESWVRTAVSLGKVQGGSLAAYFGDGKAIVYAVDAASGKLLWKSRVDEYPSAAITGAPTLHGGRLYVPVAAREETAASEPKYECCKARGSVVALDAASGAQLWKTYTVRDEPHPVQKNSVGTQLWGPSGAGVWNSPTIDAKRNVLYVGTGNNYLNPVTEMSDAVVAIDLRTGKVKWFRQLTPDDTWNGSCLRPDPVNCTNLDAPDYDFGASPAMVRLKDGRELVIAHQKSGIVYALDPGRKGEIVWQQRVGPGGSPGTWGPAIDGQTVFAANGPKHLGRSSAFDMTVGGISAVDLATGKKLWYVAAPGCGGRKPCNPAQSAAVTALPGVVFSGSDDGHLRAYAAGDGKVLWDFDTAREFTTVNGIKASGGSLDNGGPAVVDGMLFVNSGYSRYIPGNVLLAFSTDGE